MMKHCLIKLTYQSCIKDVQLHLVLLNASPSVSQSATAFSFSTGLKFCVLFANKPQMYFNLHIWYISRGFIRHVSRA